MKNFETLEVGKTYKNRCGTLVKIVKMLEEDNFKCFNGGPFWYLPNGQLYEDQEYSADLVECVQTYDIEDLRKVAIALREYIDALPSDVVAALPAMPGCDRDWVDEVIQDSK